MNVFIPCVDATGHQAQLVTPYQEAPVFAVWDSKTDQLDFVENPLAHKASACASAAVRWLQKHGANVLICAELGRRAAERLSKTDIQVLQSDADDVGTLLTHYRNGDLVSSQAVGRGHEACGSHRQRQHGHHHNSGGCGHPHRHPPQGRGQGCGHFHTRDERCD